MTEIEEIHQSVIDADDLEEVREDIISVGDVLVSLLRHPAQMILRWNWKAALLGAILRASFYFTVYKASKESWVVTLTAVLVELTFRFVTSGISGSLVQSFRRAQPVWMATLLISISLPIFSHSVEYFTHFAQEKYFSTVFAASENNARQKAFAISVLFSILSALFNLFAMRHGVLLVGAGEETKTLWGDLKRIPLLVLEFITYLPLKIIDFIKGKNFIPALSIFLSFGIIVGGILGVFRGKWSWAWTTALGAWAVLLFATVLIAVLVRIFQLRPEKPDF
ncbi:MAG: hypothetical protein ABIP06_07255 [Pyrinomonadaceae bacterium]